MILTVKLDGRSTFLNFDDYCVKQLNCIRLNFNIRYVFPYETCVMSHLSSCDNDTLEIWTSVGYSIMHQLEGLVHGCNSDICGEPSNSPCGVNGECISLVNIG